MIVSAALIDAWVTGQTRPRKQPETHGPCECAGLEQNLAGVDLPACETEKSEVTGRDLVLLTISPRSGHESRNYGASVCRRRDHEIQSSNGAGRSPRNRASAKLGSWSSGRFDDRPDPLEAPRLSCRANHQRCGRAWVGLLLDNRCG